MTKRNEFKIISAIISLLFLAAIFAVMPFLFIFPLYIVGIIWCGGIEGCAREGAESVTGAVFIISALVAWYLIWRFSLMIYDLIKEKKQKI